MQDRKTGVEAQGDNKHLDDHSEISIEERLHRTAAMLAAHCLITETLMHALCFGDIGINRTRIVNVLDLVCQQLADGLGGDNKIVKAFSDQRDSLRSLLVTSVIRADLQMRGDLQSIT